MTEDMNSPEHNRVIRTVLADVGRLSCSTDTITDDADLFELGLTSHATVNVMLELEDHFDIEFPDQFLKRSTFESISSLLNVLNELDVP